MEEVPVNNVIVDELMHHLGEPYSKELLAKYTSGCSYTNMDHKDNRSYDTGSIYHQIVKHPIKTFLDMDSE